MGPNSVIEVEDLTVEFRTEFGTAVAVRNLSLTIGLGETVVLVGESGSGKSVTALAIMQLVGRPAGRITSGAIRFRGKDGVVRDLAQLPERELRTIRGNDIAMIFQEPMTSLDPVFTIGRQIGEAVVAHQGVGWAEANRRSAELLTLLGFSEPERRLRTYPHELSGGMRQRVMIAMALACRPALLIADEPTTALDVTIQAQILHEIARFQRDLDMSMLFITHNLGVAAHIADRVVVMYTGRTIEEAPVRDLFARPMMPYTKGLLGSVPRLGAAGKGTGELVSIPGNVPPITQLPAGCTFNPRCAWAQPVRCTTTIPPYERVGEAHRVACVRWREIAEGQA
jgi:oligopeptide/dipeptide ABC transporter ATP-binding protein